MIHSNTFIHLLSKILDSKRKSIKLLNYIKDFKLTFLLDKNSLLFFIKCITIILSHYPEKFSIILKFLKIFVKSEVKEKHDLLKFFKKLNLNKLENNLDDHNMDLLIFKTFNLFEEIYSKENIINEWFFLNLLVEMFSNISKIKTENINLLNKIYFVYLSSSIKIIKESNKLNKLVLIRIFEVYKTMTRLINNFLEQ